MQEAVEAFQEGLWGFEGLQAVHEKAVCVDEEYVGYGGDLEVLG